MKRNDASLKSLPLFTGTPARMQAVGRHMEPERMQRVERRVEPERMQTVERRVEPESRRESSKIIFIPCLYRHSREGGNPVIQSPLSVTNHDN